MATFEGLVALDAKTGKTYWSLPFRPKAPDSVNATSPIVYRDHVLMVTGPGPGSICVRLLPEEQHEVVWRDRRVLDSQFNTLTVIEGFAYGFTSRRQGGASFRCVDFLTGELKWSLNSAIERGSFLAVDGHFVLWGENGHLGAVAIDPSEVRLVSITDEPLMDAPCYASPALCDGRLYLRNDSQLICLDMRNRDDLMPEALVPRHGN